MAKDQKLLYSALAGKSIPLAGLLALVGGGVLTSGEESMDGANLTTWVGLGALLVGIVKVAVDGFVEYRKRDFTKAINEAAEANERADKAETENRQLQGQVAELKAEVKLAKNVAKNAGASADELSLE